MMFAVDVYENRRQRARMGDLLRVCGVIEPKDLVLSTHLSGGFYRYLISIHKELSRMYPEGTDKYKIAGFDNRNHRKCRRNCALRRRLHATHRCCPVSS